MNDVRHDAGEEEVAAQAINVAVLGASAGGVDALSRTIAGLPADPGFAIAVLTHLDPHHDSQLPDVLQKQTTLPVAFMQHEEAIEHGRVYVLPPGSVAQIKGVRVALTPRPEHGPNLPIDSFMLSA